MDHVALIDLDGTCADYDSAMLEEQRKLQAPCEPPYRGRYEEGEEPDHVFARRKLIQAKSGFWRNLRPLPFGFEVIEDLREVGFKLHVLTKGPLSTPSAWSEKLEWCRERLPDALVTVGSDKSLVYGRVLFDDFPPYFLKWLIVRPRGLVVCLAHPWNAGFAAGGEQEHSHVFRYDGTNREELRARLRRAYARKSREDL